MEKKQQFLHTCLYMYFSRRNVNAGLNASKYQHIIECIFFVFTILTYLISLVGLYCWSVLDNQSLNVHEFLFYYIKISIPGFLILLLISITFHLYIVSVIICACFQQAFEHIFYMSKLHKFFIMFSLSFFIALFCVLGIVWPDNSQWCSIAVSFEITSPFLQLCALVVWVLLFIYCLFLLRTFKSMVLKCMIELLYVIVLMFLLSIPFWLYSPCIGKNTENLVKPKIFGHRGAPTLAPENTMMSFEKAVQSGVYGLESDIRISRDGVAFLLHDPSLLRTTNVKDVFPSRQNDRPESFTWSELRQLNVGKWFMSYPYREHLTKSDENLTSFQKIPSFSEWLSFAAKHNKSVTFDLFSPPQNHVNYSNYLHGLLQTVLDSGIPQNSVIWPCDPYESFYVKSRASNIRLKTGKIIEDPSYFHIDIFNLPYEESTESMIQQHDVLVTEYVVDTRLTYSRAWCQGAWAVTTNYPAMLSSMSKPSWILTFQQYYGVWISVEFLSLLCIILIFYYTRKKFQAKYRLDSFEMTPGPIKVKCHLLLDGLNC